MGLMHDNWLIPAGTLIVGPPEETEGDIIKTIELIDDLKDVRSLIVPLFFVPMGRLKDEEWFKETQMTKLHQELPARSLEHGIRWADELIDLPFSTEWKASLVKPFYKIFVSMAKFKARQSQIDIKV
jgi:radical SAM superfamily enzyme YgiQ (UPF0313 family)